MHPVTTAPMDAQIMILSFRPTKKDKPPASLVVVDACDKMKMPIHSFGLMVLEY
jgi:hypothetical protein